MTFEPTRTAALTRLKDFIPLAGSSYAMRRNFDLDGHPYVSGLSPYLRHRVITEAEVLHAVKQAHPYQNTAKFIDEVFWRTYWKGWLELRPDVWRWYQSDLTAAHNRLQTEAGLRRNWEDACTGNTGIACFDHWAKELAATGYLHNHARMWFASIWIFTLGLPWTLGADFFLRHLLDGDPASNTLSWRWIAGLQTKGKTYLATADNIAKYTGGQFHPKDLAKHAVAVTGRDAMAPLNLPQQGQPDRHLRTGLLVTSDDLMPQFVSENLMITTTAILDVDLPVGPLKIARNVVNFRRELVRNTQPDASQVSDIASILSWAKQTDIQQIVTPYVPVGPQQDWLHQVSDILRENDIAVCQMIRDYDLATWPYATKGFFAFRKHIPSLMAQI